MDEKIKKVLYHKAEKVETDGFMFCRISKRIEEKGDNAMKNITLTRKFKSIAVLATICILSVTCYAAAKINSYVSSANGNDQITKFPSAQEVEKSVGFQPKYVEQFTNGFKFESAMPGHVEARDAEENTLESAKEIVFSYEHANKAGLFLTLDATTLKGETEVYQETISLDGIKAGYENVDYKFVPAENSEKYITKEDRKLEAEGKLYISVGASKVEQYSSQGISWEEDGIQYTLLDMGYEIPKQEFIEMAKEVVNK